MRQEQRQWIVQVRNPCITNRCLDNAYTERIAKLSGISLEGGNTDLLEDRDKSSVPTDVERPTPAATESPKPAIDLSQPVSQVPVEPSPASTAVEPVVKSDSSSSTIVPSPVVIPAKPAIAVTPFSDTPSSAPSQTTDWQPSSLTFKLIALILLINAIATFVLHKNSKLTIYSDYTDATFTGIAPLFAILAYVVLRFFEISENTALISSLILLACLILVVIKETHRENGLSIYFAMALITKLTVVFLYYALIAMFLMGSGSARRKGERKTSFEARQRREAKASAAAMAGTTALFAVLSALMCRNEEFTALSKYLAVNPRS